jgi:hypothetical protein
MVSEYNAALRQLQDSKPQAKQIIQEPNTMAD